MADTPHIQVNDLTVGYGSEALLKDLNFEIARGQIFFVLGTSGCGKSTVLKTLIGLLPPISGDVLIDGRSIVNAGGAEKREIMQSFGVAYQSGALFGALTLEQNITLILEEFTEQSEVERTETARSKLALVGLEESMDLYPAELSGGMKKRAGLARALALDPKLLFFDEPSSGLDPITSAALDRLLLRLRDSLGTTMVIVSHELASTFSIADEMIMLDGDSMSILAQGDPQTLRDSCEIEIVREFLNRGEVKPV
jgi:phospholipid/cholesterol/gamma-HCH transport system ATP-binding protein